MRKASSRGFGFTAIAILVLLMALSAFLTKAEATEVTQGMQGQLLVRESIDQKSPLCWGFLYLNQVLSHCNFFE